MRRTPCGTALAAQPVHVCVRVRACVSCLCGMLVWRACLYVALVCRDSCVGDTLPRHGYGLL